MVSQKVNGVSLKQAVEEFGSLQKAINSLKTQKKTLQTDLLALTRDIDSKEKVRVKYLDDLNHLKKTIEEWKQELRELEDAFEKYKQGVDEFITNNKKFMLQYYMVESLVAMLRTSPSAKESIKELASNISILGDVVWRYTDEPDKLRKVFINIVLGDHLHCYRCDMCGLKFIANQEAKSHLLGYHCPNCSFMSSMKADDSFLEAVLGPPGNSSEANETQEQEDSLARASSKYNATRCTEVTK